MIRTRLLCPAALVLLAAACAREGSGDTDTAAATAAGAATTAAGGDSADAGGGAGAATRIGTLEGFKGPESVRYDPAQDVYFVSNVNGSPGAKDGNGFISRVKGDGSAVDSLMFIAGGRGGVTLHAPKGMALVGDTLVVADIDAVRMFNARTGAPVGSVSFAGMKASFLNDVVVGGDGAIYVTDTGIRFSPKGEMSHPGPDRVFKVTGRAGSVAIADSALSAPNGIAWDQANNRFIIGTFSGKALLAWTPGSAPTKLADGPGQYDGVEVLPDGRVLTTSWTDSSVYAVRGSTMTKLVSGVNSPADIGVNPSKGVLVVPMLAENRVEFWNIGGRR